MITIFLSNSQTNIFQDRHTRYVIRKFIFIAYGELLRDILTMNNSQVEVQPDIDVKKIKVYGSGIDHCRAQIPSSFKIDASSVGKAPLDVSLQTDRGNLETKPEVYDNGDGTYDVVYVAGAEGSTLTAKILYNGEHIPNRYANN